MPARPDARCTLSKENGCLNASAHAAVRPRQTLSLAPPPPRQHCPRPLPRFPPCLPRPRGADAGEEEMGMREEEEEEEEEE